ncbi:MAG TPA: histidine phosphatase family protein [Nannocystis exedens]|nr:histidine phosphatase family protein [Nannocystis exedens]
MGRSRLLILRHAERPPLVKGEGGAELSITGPGKAAAFALGRSFGSSLVSLRTSPVRRCKQTSKSLLRGADVELSIVCDRGLGDPGAFIADPDLAWQNWSRLQQDGVLAHLASLAGPLPGFTATVPAAFGLIGDLLVSTGGRAGVHVAVTHDALMIPLLVALRGRPLERGLWPDYLEWIELWQEERQLCFRWRGEEGRGSLD